MSLINSIVKTFLKNKRQAIDYCRHQAAEGQQRWFHHLLNQGQQTVWGQQHGFSSIKNITQYRSQVPLQDYESLQPYIKQMMEGKPDILWPGTVRWYAQSSGTTSDRSKFIPIPSSNRKYCHYKAGYELMAVYSSFFPDTQLFSGKGLVIGGSHRISQLNRHSYYGDLSAVLLQNMSPLTQWFRSPTLSVALMEEWEEKIDRMAEAVLQQKITSISGVPTWTLVLFKKLCQKAGVTHLNGILADLEVYIHGGVNFTPYYEQFLSYFPDHAPQFWQTYNASEGFFGIQDRPGADDMLLLTDHGIFYEFMPLSALEDPQPTVYTLDEVEKGQQYALVITTNSGLWRYQLGDTITFTNTQPYRIKVTGRTTQFINAFGEEVIVKDADDALSLACQKTDAQIKEYTAGPVYFSESDKGCHEWWIEFEQPPANFQQFKEALDENLQSVNSDYEAKRYKSLALKRPIIREVPPGTFYQWLKSKNKLGGQHKVPRLANHRQYIEELASFVDSQPSS